MVRDVLWGPMSRGFQNFPFWRDCPVDGSQRIVGAETFLFGATAPSMRRNVLWGPRLSFLARLPHRWFVMYYVAQVFPVWRDCPIDGL